MTVNWNGVFPALTTQFTEDDQLDLPLIKHHLQAQLSAGVHGIILGGSLGEASVLTLQEKEMLVKFAVSEIGDQIPVIMNIAEGATREAVNQARLASKWGCKGLMLLPPMRYYSDHRETVTFLKSVAAETDLPIMIYNNPVDYKIEVTLDMFEQLLECKNITAVKESTRDPANVTRLLNRFGGKIKILCGVDTLALEEMILGAHGWVAGLVCAFPQETVALYHLVKSGRLNEAIALNRWFMPLLELDIFPKLVQYIKLAASENGLGTERVRAPRLILEGEERERILAIIRSQIAQRPDVSQYLPNQINQGNG
jgi:dihydrodipicolinate synthase/N-acetylneuraminate lyase